MGITWPAGKANPEVLIIDCFDPRFKLAFNWLPTMLEAEESKVLRIRVPGGPAPLAHEEKPRDFTARRDEIILALSHFPSLQTVVAVGHEDCAWYGKNPDNHTEKEDLPKIVQTIREISRDKEILVFYFRFNNQNRTEIALERIKQG